MMRTVESALSTHCLFMQGSAGDLSALPRPDDTPPGDDPRLADSKLDVEQASLIKAVLKLDDQATRQRQRDMLASGYRMESFARRLGEEVIAIARSCETKVPASPSIQGKLEPFEFESRVDFANPAVRLMFGIAFFPELAAAASAEQNTNRVHATLTTVLLNGELALVGGSGEFFCHHSTRLKERSYAAKTLFFGYCNGHSMYFPTIEAASQGGYGADPQVSWVEIGAGEKMMNQALINIFSMQGKLNRSLLAP
jgi:hypothetical protein